MKKLIIAIAFPIIVLFGFMLYKQSIIKNGQQVDLEITGFDPRDLLSGHYLIYKIDYKAENTCQPHHNAICLTPKREFIKNKKKCDLYISGTCSNKKFKTGLERFYIPEKHAQDLDKLIRVKGTGKLRISVTNTGKAVIKDLLINKKPLKKWIKSQ